MDLVINYQNFYEKRIRDLGTLKYAMRSIENNADLFENIFFIYDGADKNLPEWLNTNSVTLVKHTDFMPDCTPTFNQHTVEMNLHRIERLNENFIYMREDEVFIKPCTKEDFFKDGKIVLNYGSTPEYDDNDLFNLEKFYSGIMYYVEVERSDWDGHLKSDKELETYIPEKGCVPMVKEMNDKITGHLHEIILNNNTFERPSDITYDVFLTGMIYAGLTIDGCKRMFVPLHLYNKETLLDKLQNTTAKIVCFYEKQIDTDEQFLNSIDVIDTFLKNLFPNKSRFEK